MFFSDGRVYTIDIPHVGGSLGGEKSIDLVDNTACFVS